MSLLAKHMPFVKEQIEFQQRMINKFSNDAFRKSLHTNSRDGFASLAKDLEFADKLLEDKAIQQAANSNIQRPLRLALTPEEIEGLPEDVLKELSISDADKAEFAILALMEEEGGILSLDRLIVGLWNKHQEKIKRQALTSRLYRMVQKDLVFNVPGKKGVYSNREISEEETTKLLSSEATAVNC